MFTIKIRHIMWYIELLLTFTLCTHTKTLLFMFAFKTTIVITLNCFVERKKTELTRFLLPAHDSSTRFEQGDYICVVIAVYLYICIFVYLYRVTQKE